MYKRILAASLAILLMFATIGCTPSKPSQTDGASSDGSTQPAGTEQAGSVDVNVGIDPTTDGGLYGKVDYSQQEQLSYTYAGVGMSTEVQDFSQCDAIMCTIEDKFNFRFAEATNLTWDNWDETMRIWINSGDMPDVMFYNVNYADLSNYVDQGLIREIPMENFAQDYPMLNNVLEKTEISNQFVERFGGLYILPRVVYRDPPTDPLVGHAMFIMRKDWLEALGFEIKDRYTPSELIDFCSQVATATDLPGAIPGQTFGIDSTHLNYLCQIFILPYNPYYDTFYYDEEKGEYVWGTADPSTLEGLRVMQEAWKKGVLHKEFYISTNRNPSSNLASGLAAAVFDCGTGMCAFGTYNQFVSVEGNDGENLHYAASVADDGIAYNSETTNYWGGTIFSPTLSDEKLTRFLQMLDWLSSDPGQYLLRLGIYGQDWGYDDEGNLEILRPKNESGSWPSINSEYQSLGNFLECMTVCTDGFSLEDPALPEEIRDAVNTSFAIKAEGQIRPIDWDLQLFSGTYYDKFVSSMQYGDELSALVVADGDLEANFNAWVEANRPVVQNVLDELNSSITK